MGRLGEFEHMAVTKHYTVVVRGTTHGDHRIVDHRGPHSTQTILRYVELLVKYPVRTYTRTAVQPYRTAVFLTFKVRLSVEEDY